MTERGTEQSSAWQPIAVTVVGGYLGAGKTTLVNEVLRNADERLAVIVNDFGDMNIDSDLIESRDEQTLSLTNGCICCSLVDGLAAALSTIEGLDPRPERLLIEASGVADPAQVAAFSHAPGLLPDAIVVVADAETVQSRSIDRYVGDTVVRQLDAADIVALNKVDLVDGHLLDETHNWLKERWPNAVIVHADHGRVSPALLFGNDAGTHEPRPPGSDHHHAHSVFETWGFTHPDPVAREVVEQLLADLPASIVRAKGIVRLSDDPDRKTVVQYVGGRWTLSFVSPWTGSPSSRLVFVGTDPDAGAWLTERLVGWSVVE